jgi:hypothetical protein
LTRDGAHHGHNRRPHLLHGLDDRILHIRRVEGQGLRWTGGACGWQRLLQGGRQAAAGLEEAIDHSPARDRAGERRKAGDHGYQGYVDDAFDGHLGLLAI